MQCKDIPDIPILQFLNKLTRWGTWFPNFDNSVQQGMPIGVCEKLVKAKMKSLIKRGLVDGCTCGCRGDYEITPKGKLQLEMNLKEELKKTEIKVECVNAIKQLHKKVNDEITFHFVGRDFFDAEFNEVPDHRIQNWDFDSPQNLEPALEAIRVKAEKRLNNKLQKKFGVSPETTIYIICDRIMTGLGYHW
jgi:hypothetical protein